MAYECHYGHPVLHLVILFCKRMTCDIVESTSCLHSVTNILKRLPKSSVNPIFDLATPLPLKWARKRTIVAGCRVPSAPLLQT